MGATKIPVTKSAYGYPLLIKQLLHLPLSNTPDQVIVYRDQVRQTYREFGARLRRLASGLSDLGVGQGDTVAVFDWDSHGYLECFFGVPMMGAVLQTVNVRLNPERITLNHVKIPAEFVFVEELEKTSVGKYDKKAMRARYDIVL